MDASDFYQFREDIVLTFQKWSHPLVEPNASREVMAMAMCDMSNDLEEFAQLANNDTGTCFAERCKRISHSLYSIAKVVELIDNLPVRARVSGLNMLNVLADQIGRLALQGYSDDDEFAMIMAEKAKSEAYRFHHKYSDPACEEMQIKLSHFWDYLHFFLPGCTCNNCKWEYEFRNELGL